MRQSDKIELLKAYYKTHGLDISLHEVKLIQRIARQAQTNGLNRINVRNHFDKSDILLRRLNFFFGDKVKFNLDGDPRGFVLKIITKDKQELYPERFNR